MIFEVWTSSGTLGQLLTIIMVIVGIKQGFIRIKTRWITIGKKKDRRTSGVSAHTSCPNFPSLQGLVKEAIKNSDKIKDLKYETYEDQMKSAREFANDVIDKLKTNYLTMYKPFNEGRIAGLLACTDVKDYYCMLEKAKKPILDAVEVFVRGNHFAEQSEEEYRDYTRERAKKLQKITSEFLNEHYDTDDFKISREELYESNMKLMPVINVIVEAYFYKVRTMAIKTSQEIVILEESIKDFV